MSQDENLGRKEKKAQRDADRRKKGKKRKHAEIGEDSNVEQQNEFDKDFLPLDSGVVEKKDGESDKKSTKKSSRKRKADELEDVPQTKQQEADTHSTAKKSKKRKKNKDGVAKGETNGVEAEPVDKTQAHRFIVFVGNLPYNATDATIKAHFKKLEPFNLRHRTDPKTDKSKGFAFLEFENYDRMKTCLKLYHHSMFDLERTAKGEDPVLGEGEEESGERKKSKDVKPSKGARRINVELTAGGGGKAEGRKEKIRVKNERLGQQRQRRADAEKKEREKKAKEEGEASVAKPVKKKAKAGAESDAAKPVKQMSEKVETYGVAEGMTDVHPSRLARIAA